MASACLLAAAWPGTACDRGEYRIALDVPGGAARTARADVFLLGRCDEIGALGDTPTEWIRTSAIEDGGGGSALGSVPEGSYALYARAWDHDCRLFAAGCVPVSIDAGGAGTLTVGLTEIAGPSCAPGLRCEDGLCVSTAGDGGADADGDSDCVEELEPNDFVPGAQELAPGANVCGRVDSLGNEDWYAISLDAGDQVLGTICGGDAECWSEPLVLVYPPLPRPEVGAVDCGADDNHIECDGGAEENTCSTFNFTSPVTARHLVRVLAPSQAEGCYLLSFTLLGE